MLDLTLRPEFLQPRLKGTAIELEEARQMGAKAFLDLTYPTRDVQVALESIGPEHGKPVVILGERGQGKSHLLATLSFALTEPEAARPWLAGWGERLGAPKLAQLPLRPAMHVISEALHGHRYKYLWDLILDRHPDGTYIRGKWEAAGVHKTDMPSRDLMEELFAKKPTVLILDEFQTWYDGLTDTKQYPWRKWAFNFIQILSEIALKHPDRLVLVVSIRNNNSDAYQQVHRVAPVLVDFKGPSARQDRVHLLLHRLFANRGQIPADRIRALIEPHVAEYLRLHGVPPADHAAKREEFVSRFPFSPDLLELLEDQVLVAVNAQETRDLIRILASLYKRSGEKFPVLTAAAFDIQDERSSVAALIDSVADRHHNDLRQKALRNLEAVKTVLNSETPPYLGDLVSSLWLRSLSPHQHAGASPRQLQADLTRDKPLGDDDFAVALGRIEEYSFNIHKTGERLRFREEENPQARLLAHARNDKLFEDGRDQVRLAKELRHLLAGPQGAQGMRIVVLPRFWRMKPWDGLESADQPAGWEQQIPLLVVPESLDNPGEALGPWLKEHVPSRRNTARFLLQRKDVPDLYTDEELILRARCICQAEEWKAQAEYRPLFDRYTKELRDLLKARFDRYAVVEAWNFPEPTKSRFACEAHQAEGAAIPEAVNKRIAEDLFIPEEFAKLAEDAAQASESLGKFVRDLQEPRPNQQQCIPWLGLASTLDRLASVLAGGKIAVNLRGSELLQVTPDEAKDAAVRRFKSKLAGLSGRMLDETQLGTPQAQTIHAGVGAAQPTPLPLAPTAGTVPSTPWPMDARDAVSTPTPTGAPTTPAPSAAAIPFSTEQAANALNLLARIEKWGIQRETKVGAVTVGVDQLTGEQLARLIKSLPEGMNFHLSLRKE